MSDLLSLFNARQGVVCCVGAGGKKTTMFQLANAHTGRVGITATAHIEYFPESLEATKYIAEENELLTAIRADSTSEKIAFAKPSQRFGRRAGVSCESIPEFIKAGQFELLVVKSDGARGRKIKAPAEHEPVIPDKADTVIPVVSAKVFGMPLTGKLAHRVEHVTNVTGLKENHEIKPEHIARLLVSDHGSLKNTGAATVIPLINMVDYADLEMLARKAAEQALEQTDRFDKVVLASMREQDPIIDVIAR